MLSPSCQTAVRAHIRGAHDVGREWHGSCQFRDTKCTCLCHRDASRSVIEVVQHQTRLRLVEAGINPDAPPGHRQRDMIRGICGKGHDISGENATNSGGECRECRRDSSHRSKQKRRALQALDAKRLVPRRGRVVAALPPRQLGRYRTVLAS